MSTVRIECHKTKICLLACINLKHAEENNLYPFNSILYIVRPHRSIFAELYEVLCYVTFLSVTERLNSRNNIFSIKFKLNPLFFVVFLKETTEVEKKKWT